MTAGRIAYGIDIDAADVEGRVVSPQLFDRASRGLHDPNRMVWIFLMNDFVGACECRNGSLSPLRLIRSLPDAEPWIVFEESHDAPQAGLAIGLFPVDTGQFLQKRVPIQSRACRCRHELLLALRPIVIPNRVSLAFSDIPHRTGANQEYTSRAKFLEGKLSARSLRIGRRRKCDTN